MPKTVLLVSYYYPPTNNGGAQRPASFAKYLKEYGYNTVVITCNSPGGSKDDAGIVRISDSAALLTEKGGLQSLFFRSIRKILFRCGIIPGNYYWWYKCVMRVVQEIIQTHRPDIILSTFPNQENLMIGMNISRTYNIPLVLDFRDGMVFESVLDTLTPWASWRLKQLERRLISRAARVITVAGPITEYFNKTYHGCHARTITNGFDPDEWVTIGKMELGNKINIVHTGQFSYSRKSVRLKMFVKAINTLTENEKNRICFHMVGRYSKEEIEQMSETGTSEMFHFIGNVDRRKALQYQRSADLLMLITSPGKRSIVTGKLFEYLAAGKPIFAVTKGSAAEEIINKTGTGICVSPDDVNGIAAQLKRIIYEHPHQSFFTPSKESIEQYRRNVLTKQLAAVFDDVLQSRQSAP